MKTDFTVDDCNILTQALRLKRESLLRSRKKEVPASVMFHFYNSQIVDLDNVETKLFTLFDSGVK